MFVTQNRITLTENGKIALSELLKQSKKKTDKNQNFGQITNPYTKNWDRKNFSRMPNIVESLSSVYNSSNRSQKVMPSFRTHENEFQKIEVKYF